VGLPVHIAPFNALVTIPDGGCEVRVAGNTFPMKTGETIIFPTGVPQAVSAVTKFKMSLVMIKE
jgi:quercetin dioxygenase-like cupin family protein